MAARRSHKKPSVGADDPTKCFPPTKPRVRVHTVPRPGLGRLQCQRVNLLCYDVPHGNDANVGSVCRGVL